MQQRVLFLVKKRQTTYSPPFGLLHSAKFVAAMLMKHGIHAKVIQVTDANDIDREVVKFNPNLVVLEALWVTPEKLSSLLSLSRHSNRAWTVRLHSKISFLAMEGMAMEWIRKMAALQGHFPNFMLSSNNPFAVEEYEAVFNVRFGYLPNYYIFPKNIERSPQTGSNWLNIGCFGALRPLKNHLAQAFGAIQFAEEENKKLRFYINSNRIEQHAEPVLKNLRALFKLSGRHELVEVPWLNHSDFIQLASKMDLGMQVSFSDTFNIVTADLVSVGTPTVVSSEMFWMPPRLTAKTTDTFDMAKKLNIAYNGWGIRRKQKCALISYNKKAEKTWLNCMKDLKND